MFPDSLNKDAPCAQVMQRLVADSRRRRPMRAIWNNRTGASAIVLALSMSAVLGAAGLAVDAGLWYNDKRTEQGVSDLAAWTGAQTYASELATNNSATSTSQTDGQNAAQAVAGANNFTSGVNGVTVKVNAPAASGPNAGVAGTFEVIISKKENLFFSSRFLKTVTVASRSVSQYKVTTVGSGLPACILALNTLVIDSGGKISTTSTSGCSIDVNGTSSSAFTVQNGAHVTVDGLNVVGGTTTPNGSHLTVNDSQYDVQSGGTVTADPYASLTFASAESPANATGCVTKSGGTNISKGGTASCGYYNGGLTLSGSATLNPGTYVINGGTFTVGDGATVTATSGVTIVLTGGASVDIDSGGELDITAPTTGPTAGLIFYGDPASTGTMNFSDGSKVNANGAYYFPASTVNFASGSSTTVYCAQLIGYNIYFSDGANYALDNSNCATYGVKQAGGTTTTTTVKMVE